jgi:DNA-binding CsgD family transcriptional regulator
MTDNRHGSGLLGRQGECAALDRLLADVRAHRSRVLVVRGEAGVGKTSLLEYLAANASGCHVVRATGVDSEMELAFAGLHQLCAPLLHRREHLPPPQRDALGVAFGLTVGPPPDRFLIGLATLSLFAEVAEERPLLCVVDDAHWLDQTSVDVLAFVGRRLLAESIGVVVSVRDPIGGFEGVRELKVGPLGPDDSRALLRRAIHWQLDDRVMTQVLAEAGGNPLALMEVPRASSPPELEYGLVPSEPETVATRIEHGFIDALRELPDDSRRLVLLAALEPLGDVTLVWRAATSLDIDRGAAGPIEATGLLTLGLRVRFRHPLVRAAARRIADRHEVRAAHRALAAVTDMGADPERHAWHRAHAAAGPNEEVAGELVNAASRARARGGFSGAAALLERAVEMTPDPARRGSRARTAALAKLFAADHEGGLALVSVAELCPLDDVERAKLGRVRASLMTARGADAASLSLLEAAKQLEPFDADSARGAHLGALSTHLFVGRLGAGDRLHDFAQAARAAPPPSGPPRVTDLLLDALTTRVLEGYDAGLPLLRRATDSCVDETEPGSQLAEWTVFIPTLSPEVWDDERWDRLTAHLVAASRTAGGSLNLAMALDYRAAFDLQAGNFTRAAAMLQESTVIKEATGSTPALTSVELAAWRGQEEHAMREAAGAMELWSARGEGRWISLAEYAKAILFNGLGRYEEALVAARRSCEHDDIGIHGRALAELVEASARCGERDEAEQALAHLERQAAVAGTDWALGVAARCRALCTGGDVTHRRAVDHLAATRMRVDLARARLVYGEWLRREHRRTDAREQLRLAHDELGRIGAAAFAERARRELLATGERVRRHGTHARVMLTAQETEIARLAGQGATNPEIGSRLFVSPRTVEYHLHNVFTKLGITSRRELRSALHRLGGAVE